MLTKFLASIDLFRDIDSKTVSLLAETCTPVTIAAHDILIRDGDAGNELYLLQHGALEVILTDIQDQARVVATIGPGESVGEIALLTGAARSATIRATEASSLWRMARQDFDQIAAADPSLRTVVEQAILGKIYRANMRSALYENQIFGALDTSVIQDLESEMELVLLKGGEQLIRQGDPSDSLYLIVSGRLRILLDADGEPQIISQELGRGQTVGEVGLLTNAARSASVYAIRDSLVGRLREDAYFRLLQKHPQALTRLFSAQVMKEFIQKSHSTVRRHRTKGTFAIIGLGEDVPIHEFAERLTQSVNRQSAALYINDRVTNQALGESDIAYAPLDSAAHIRMQNWFNEQEAHHDYLVYSCAAPDVGIDYDVNSRGNGGVEFGNQSVWTARTLQQADHILYVAWADSDPSSLSIPRQSRSGIPGTGQLQVRYSLILLHPVDRHMPLGTQRWLDALTVETHHHVRWHMEDDAQGNDLAKNNLIENDLGRVARLLTGNGIGVVLSGGTARGFAQAGVIRALREAQVPIDLIGCVSVGAIMGGMLAAGYTDQQISDIIMRTDKNKDLTDYTLPFTAFFSGKRYSALLRSLFGNIHIEDTWQPYFCLSTDLSAATEVIHRRGPLWKYVRASSGFPVLLPPVTDKGRPLIDGGMLNNFPTDVMRRTVGCGIVIGIDTTGGTGIEAEYEFGSELSGWRQLVRKLSPFAKPIHAPGLSDTILALSAIGAVGRLSSQRMEPDLYIRPPIHPFKMMDYGRRAEIMDVGYRAARPVIDEWLASRNDA